MNAVNFLCATFKGRKLATVGFIWLCLIALAAIAAPLIAPFDPLEIDPVGRLAQTRMAKPIWHRSLWSRHVLAGDLRRAHDSNHRRGQRDCGTCCGWRGWHAIGLFYATWAFPDAWRRRADGLSGFADGAGSDHFV